jgi:hypothetical protein
MKGENMDALILSLTPAQHKKYLELVDCKNTELNFKFEHAHLQAYSDEKLQNAKDMIISSCQRIISLKKHSAFFSRSLDKDEIEKLIPIYFEVVRSITAVQSELYGEAILISREISKIENSLIEASVKYSDFLPYKAAFGKTERYKDEIIRIDTEFLNVKSNLTKHKKLLANELSKISNICDILIPDFFQKSAHAADSPRFKGFNDNEFFATVFAFLEQIKNV